MQVRVLEVLEEPDDGKLSDTVCPVETHSDSMRPKTAGNSS